MAETLDLSPGFLSSWIVELKRAADSSAVLTTDADAPPTSTTFSVSIYAGPGRQPYALSGTTFAYTAPPTRLGLPTAAWTGLLSISSADSQLLDPGLNQLSVSYTDPGTNQPVEVYHAGLRVPVASGTAAEVPTRTTYQDMLQYAGKALQDLGDELNRAGFYDQRLRARSFFDAVIQRRKPPFSALAFSTTSPYSAWPALDYGQRDLVLQAKLDNDKTPGNPSLLVLTPEVIEIHARLAISYVFEAQVSFEGKGQDPYHKLAALHRARAETLISSNVVEVLNQASDTVPSYVIPLGTLTIRSGHPRY